MNDERRSPGARRLRAAVLALSICAVLVSGCRRNRTIELAWDVPASLPASYRVLVDGRVARELPPPQEDRSCRCLKASVELPPGEHKVRVEACNPGGVCAPSAELTAH